MKNILILPPLLPVDFVNLKSSVEVINCSEANWLHMDVIDGVSVPNISSGFPVVSAASKIYKKPLDVHLMIVQPERYIEQAAKAGACIMSVQYGACAHLHRTIQQIHAAGTKAGVVLNPSMPVHLLGDVICDVDLVLFMSVNPGFGGQTFIKNTINKVKRFRKPMDECGPKVLIEVDGGVQGETAPRLVQADADVLVSSSYVFKSEDPESTTKQLKSLSTSQESGERPSRT